MTDTSKIEELLDMLDRGSMVPATDYALKEAATTIRALLEREAKLRGALGEIDSLDPQCDMDTLAREAVNGLVVRMGANARQTLQETDNAG